MKLPFKSLRSQTAKPTSAVDAQRHDAIVTRKAGDAARDRGDWLNAIEHYGLSLKLNPNDPAVMIQYGHMLKEAGQLDDAVGAYRRAIALEPDNADAHLQLGHSLKLSDRPDDAIEAYATAITLDNQLAPARDELIALGAAERLPSQITGRTAAHLNLTQLHRLLEQGLEAVQSLNALSTYPLENYDLFRRHFPIQAPPPTKGGLAEILILIDASDAQAHSLRASLRSLQNQVHTSWRAIVHTSSNLAQHPVASMALEDSRFIIETDLKAVVSHLSHLGLPLVLLDSGTQLDPSALSWLCYAASRTSADLVYTDHDTYEPHWQYGDQYRDPVLQAHFDPDDMATTPWVPAVLLVQPTMAQELTSAALVTTSAELRRSLLLTDNKDIGRAHIPRLLASCPATNVSHAPSPDRVPSLVADNATGRILVIIPTRDEPEMLKTCIDSLYFQASHPERLDFLIVDNNSSSLSKAQFNEIVSEGRARVLDVSEPFNWSRLNNLAVQSALTDGSQYESIIFANNDIKALTRGWDETVLNLLADPTIGIIGPRLLYPNGHIQHAGILLGGHLNRPVHDGLHSLANETGPLCRLQRQRGVAAVTGAFMVVRPSVFAEVGGFDTELAVAYNDIDFCFKVRALGHRVVYAPSIELIHYESVSRGTNVSAETIAWDDSELSTLYARWGEWLFFDPTRNQQWTSRQDKPFDGFRDLTISQVLDSLDRGARPRPWSIAIGNIASN